MRANPDQIGLFEDFMPDAARTPKLALPFQRSNEIDIKRACRILGVTEKTLGRMLVKQLIRGYRHPGAPWHIEYDSVVEYCDQLRVLHCISDDRVGIAAGRRRRDHDLLPFPLAETISMSDAQERLDISHNAIVHLIEMGSLTGYQVLFETKGCPWRIHAPSLERYIESLHIMAGKRPSSRPALPSR